MSVSDHTDHKKAPEKAGKGRKRGQEPLSIVREIVLNMSVLMFAAIVMIALMIYQTNNMWVREYAKYTPLFIIPYIVLFGIVVAVFGGRLIRNLILKPLRELLEATQKVAEGDLSTRVEVTENKEMSDLAESFNVMTEKLAENRSELEQSIEQMRRLNENLARTQRELLSSEKLASVGRLAAGVAHEIGNPLSSIQGYLEIINKRDYLRQSDRDMVSRVQDEVKRINEIIKELLDYSRPQDESLSLLDLNESVDSALTLLSAQKGCDNIEIKTELGALPMLEANRSSMKQLIMNMVMNSIQAMPEGGSLGVITRAAERGGEQGMELMVEDTGPGVPEELIDRIFDPFFTTKQPGQGTGLGLSICYRIVENLGGRIEVKSSPENGSMFTVWLPAAVEGENDSEEAGK